MRGQWHALPFVLSVGVITGCGFLPAVDPRHIEERTVTPVADQSRVLTLKEPEIWYDGPMKVTGIRFPDGTYSFEGEDDTFWYFRAPTPVELRVQRPNGLDDTFVEGGIALRKTFDVLGVFAEGYAEKDNRNSDPTKKLLIWKLGNDFRRMEGSNWTKNF